MTVGEFADKYLAPYKLKGDEVIPERCPFCHGGEHGDKYTFALNAETGAYNCKRGTCGVQGAFPDLLQNFGLDPSSRQGGMVSLEAHQVKQFERAFPYHEKAGKAVLNGKVFYHYRFWVGSSQYDTREMSILIDGIVDECKQIGLETWPPDQIALLKDNWQEAG